MATTLCPPRPSTTQMAHLHAGFLALVPTITNHARIHFRGTFCPERRADQVAEAVALGWKWYLSLRRRGKDPARFPHAFAALLARAVRCGRRLCGQERARDALSPAAQRRGGFRVGPLPSTRAGHHDLYARPHGQEGQDALEERLRDNAITPPPDAAAFRIDFPAFLGAMPDRDRGLALCLSLGHSAKWAAMRYRLSQG